MVKGLGLQAVYGRGPHLLLWTGSRAASGIYNGLNYCVIYVYVYHHQHHHHHVPEGLGVFPVP